MCEFDTIKQPVGCHFFDFPKSTLPLFYNDQSFYALQGPTLREILVFKLKKQKSKNALYSQ